MEVVSGRVVEVEVVSGRVVEVEVAVKNSIVVEISRLTENVQFKLTRPVYTTYTQTHLYSLL